ncbi:2-oxo acid dehydrogenase subunit E2 [Cryptosporangium phraense]|uniref:Dihydrolipoamide acetyltransferase component of pyruvate dehydrogenase complex n=1 Tax=Cryptosporangium phraense TaxID=2593070 RepID=A0A545AXS6_9ACTN|nr:2-oxo acid dehydrogenase subunit E2 [Cryptosporangium phraense]TQS46136.1 hypothetical protein FL583_06555 [Cryptosporangium phraense]
MHILHLPRLGQTMQVGVITNWVVEVGKPFEVGDVLYELETEKNRVEIEAKVPGTLRRILVADNEPLDIGTSIAAVADPGEEVDDPAIDAALAAEATGAPAPTDAPAVAAPPSAGAVAVAGTGASAPGADAGAPSAGAPGAGAGAGAQSAGAGVIGGGTPGAGAEVPAVLAGASPTAVGSGAAAAGAGSVGVDLRPGGASANGTGSDGGGPGRRRVVPRARRVARDLGVDLDGVAGSGPEGQVTIADVEAFAVARATAAQSAAPAALADPTAGRTAAAGTVAAGSAADSVPAGARGGWSVGADGGRFEQLAGVPRAMADSVSRAWRDIPQFVQQITVDATGLLARRETPNGRATLTDLVISAVAAALGEVPQVNARYHDGGLEHYDLTNVGVAVATDRGLIVPTIAGVNPVDVTGIGRRLRELTDRAQHGTLRADDQAPAAVTVSNLGRYGVETGVPLVTEGQTALVFVGAVVERVAVVNGGIVVQPQMGIAIAYDHRVLDGLTAAKFTGALKARLEAR